MRLYLEYTATPYTDIARERQTGVDEMLAILQDKQSTDRPFAPPFLVNEDGVVLAQTSNILQFLGSRHGLVPTDEQGSRWVHQLQLTIGDFVDEIHDTHHPVGGELYYEDQQTEAQRRTKHFLEYRLGKYLGYFESVSNRNNHDRGLLVNNSVCYADLSMYQVIAGLGYAFPKTMQTLESKYPCLHKLHGYISENKCLQDYFNSARRLAFNQTGIFRHYPELEA